MERRIIQLGIVGQGDDGGAAVDRELVQRVVGPFAVHGDAGKARVGRESPARIDHDHVVSRQRRHRRQGLRDVDGADDDDPQRRVERVDEQSGVADLHDAAAVLAEEAAHFGQLLPVKAEAAVGDVIVDQRLEAGAQVRDQGHRAFLGARPDQALKDVGLHSTAST